jgi:hypothetical protein
VTWVVAWLGVVALLAVANAVAILFFRVLRPLLEIKRYADDILESGLGIARHLDGADEIAGTRELARSLAAGMEAR